MIDFIEWQHRNPELPVCKKTAERERLAREQAEFFARGGQVYHAKPGEGLDFTCVRGNHPTSPPRYKNRGVAVFQQQPSNSPRLP